MKTILIVVDIQNGFIRYDQTRELANKIIKLVNGGIFDSVIATRFLNHEGSPYIKLLNWNRLLESPDIDLVEGLKPDKVIDKYIYTCVDDSFINLLKELNGGGVPTHVFLCGADTDCCVLKTATDLFEKDIMPIVLTAYCDSNGGPISNAAGLLVMRRLIGEKSTVPAEIHSRDDLKKIIAERQY